MNRPILMRRISFTTVPHMRGDEPTIRIKLTSINVRSPHAWG